MRTREIIEGFYQVNDENLSRPLLESVVAPEVTLALKNWIGSTNVPGVLIGGLALSFYVRPRHTINIDVLYLADQDIPQQIPGFKKIRGHSFQHNKTHVEVEVLSAQFLGIPPSFVKKVQETAVESNGMRIASKSALVALKLFRGNRRDQGDIEQLIQSGGVNIEPFLPWLNDNQQNMFTTIQSEVSP